MTKIGEAIFVREFRTKLNIFLALQVKRSHYVNNMGKR